MANTLDHESIWPSHDDEHQARNGGDNAAMMCEHETAMAAVENQEWLTGERL